MFINGIKDNSILSAKRYPSLLSPLPPNQSLKLTEPAVDDLMRAKQPATVGRGLPRADWLPSLRHFVAAA